ncbi:hypothetical protein [Brevibacillus daliensis]|uniref:hypothetical protein n=1 Tax=Brevibacillus daliensis TaxID=2892995 RepID=UPI001E311199|nr:hypothetical protein [Brevibacillus daliensis]
MEIQNHAELLALLESDFINKPLTVTYTDWEGGDLEDEQVTTFQGTIVEVSISDNEFEEKDLSLRFQTDEGEVEILMEIPAEESDLANQDEDSFRIFGTEAELILAK